MSSCRPPVHFSAHLSCLHHFLPSPTRLPLSSPPIKRKRCRWPKTCLTTLTSPEVLSLRGRISVCAFAFVCVRACVCRALICMCFLMSVINSYKFVWHLWCSASPFLYCVCVCVCARSCARMRGTSVERRMTIIKDFSLIIGYFIATFTSEFGPLNSTSVCFLLHVSMES